MNEKKYKKILNSAPGYHLSKEFQLFLVNNNVVVSILPSWLIIENCKYHTKKRRWYTAFYLYGSTDIQSIKTSSCMNDLNAWIPDGMALMIRPEKERSVALPHYHIFDL